MRLSLLRFGVPTGGNLYMRLSPLRFGVPAGGNLIYAVVSPSVWRPRRGHSPLGGRTFNSPDDSALQVTQPFPHEPAQMNSDHPAAVLAQRLEISQGLGAPEGSEGVG